MSPDLFERAVQWNKKWLNDKIVKGYQVVDIGPDGRSQPSRFYEAELEAVRESNHSKAALKKFGSAETVQEMRARVRKC
jgi:hypothetical protein